MGLRANGILIDIVFMNGLSRSEKNTPSRGRTSVESSNDPTTCEFYTLEDGGRAITCRICGSTSREPRHVRDKFCPRCRVFHEDRVFMVRLAEGYQTEFHSRSETLAAFRW